WVNWHLPQATSNAVSFTRDGDQYVFEIGIAGSGRSVYLVTAKVTYSFAEDGVSVAVEYKQADEAFAYYTYLPRFGLKMKLPKLFDRVSYLAYGPQETYADVYEFAVKDLYEGKVETEYYHYAKPQESGSHYLAGFAELTDGKVCVRAEGMHSFSAIPYSAETLAATAHDDELPESDATYFHCDYFMSGLGSNSCGPVVGKKYRVPQEGKGEIRFFIGKKL
ncbi:MAG: hypothetical protein IJB97_05050, partial [Clostridia bacterium]|nr:hypothetical protein [Clostridia bacterium]